MAIDRKAYKKTRYSNIKIHKDGIKFWFDFTIAGTRYSKLWESNPRHTKADRVRQAQNQLQVFRDEVMHQDSIEADMDASVNDYWLKLLSIKDWKRPSGVNSSEIIFAPAFRATLSATAKLSPRPAIPAGDTRNTFTGA